VETVASDVHRQVRRIPGDDLQSARRYRPTGAYNLAKLADILFSNELARRLGGTGVTADSVIPGFVHTGLTRDATGLFRVFFTAVRPFQAEPEQGAETPPSRVSPAGTTRSAGRRRRVPWPGIAPRPSGGGT
jgi:NAD(P)-dependent dehydrogenase (short-subunit alcohol dehydrogenase family)